MERAVSIYTYCTIELANCRFHDTATKAKLPKPAKKKSKPAALEETNLNSLAISKAENLTGGLDTGFLDSEIGSEKPCEFSSWY